MVGILAIVSSAVGRGFRPGWVKPKTINLVFAVSSLRTQLK
jgi:hypothetical protein